MIQHLSAGIALAPNLYDTLLYLCADGDKWEAHVHALNPEPASEELLASLPVVSTAPPAAAAKDSSSAISRPLSQLLPATFQRAASPPTAQAAAQSNGNGHVPAGVDGQQAELPQEVRHLCC